MWLLILTLATWDGVTIQQVGPFTTEAQCMTVANTWLKKVDHDPRKVTNHSAICARQGSILDN